MDNSIDDFATEFILSQQIENELKEKYINVVELNNNKKSKVHIVKNTQDNKIYVKKDLTNYNMEVFNIIKNIDINYIPRVYEVIEHNEILTIVEEYINGRTLSEILEGEKSLRDETIIKYIINLCDALKELHNLTPPIIHRDIKLSNIIVTNDDFAKLIDFDVSRTYKSEEKRDTTMFGTHEYAAPEQFGFAQTDGRTDIYAIGVVMNLLSTGQFPLMKKSEGALKYIIEKCIKMSPSDRYQSVEELKSELNRVKDELNKESNAKINEDNIKSIREKLVNGVSEVSEKLKKEKIKQEKLKVEKKQKAEQEKREKFKKEESLLKEKKANTEAKQGEHIEKIVKFDSMSSIHEENKNIKRKNIFKKIPGFRSEQKWKMIISSVFIYIPLGLAIAIGELALKEVALTFLEIWFLWTNFLNIREKLPLINSKNSIIKNIIGYILYTFIILFIGFVILGITLTTFGG